MSEVVVDLTNYKDRVGERVMPGRYRVVVEDAELDKSRAGNDMVNLWLRVVGGDFDSATIVDRLTMTEKSMFRVVGFMQAVGLATPKKRIRINIRQFVGKQLEVDVEDGDPYNGRVKSEVRGYLRLPKRGTQADAETDITDLSGLEEFAPVANPGDAGNVATEPEVSADGSTMVQPTTATKVAIPEDVTEDEDETTEIDLDKLDL